MNEDYETRLSRVAELVEQIRELGFAICAVGAGDVSALKDDEAQSFIDDNIITIEDTMSAAANDLLDALGVVDI